LCLTGKILNRKSGQTVSREAIFKPSGKSQQIKFRKDSFTDFNGRAEMMDGGRRGNKKTPAYAVLITFLNLFTKWVPYWLLQAFCFPTSSGKSGHAHHNQGKVPSSKTLAQKRMSITHIAGAKNSNLLPLSLNQFIRSAVQLLAERLVNFF